MIVSGIGLLALLLYLPAVIALKRSSRERGDFSRHVSMGFGLAIVAHVLLRALHSGSDLSAYGGYRLISWVLAIAVIVILWRTGDGETARQCRHCLTALPIGLLYLPTQPMASD